MVWVFLRKGKVSMSYRRLVSARVDYFCGKLTCRKEKECLKLGVPQGCILVLSCFKCWSVCAAYVRMDSKYELTYTYCTATNLNFFVNLALAISVSQFMHGLVIFDNGYLPIYEALSNGKPKTKTCMSPLSHL